MQRDFMTRARIDARTPDARDARLRRVHRGLGGEILSGADQLSGEMVNVPKRTADALVPKMGAGMGWLKARGKLGPTSNSLPASGMVQRPTSNVQSGAASPSGALASAGNTISSAAAGLATGLPMALPGAGVAGGAAGMMGTGRAQGTSAPRGPSADYVRELDAKLAVDPVASRILAKNSRAKMGIRELRDERGVVQDSQALRDLPHAGVVPHGFIGAAARARMGADGTGANVQRPTSNVQRPIAQAQVSAGAPVVNEGAGRAVVTRAAAAEPEDFRKRMRRGY